jgi:hypothetical protein
MEREHKHGPGHIFDDDELDDAIANADDTGMVRTQQQQIVEEETPEREED